MSDRVSFVLCPVGYLWMDGWMDGSVSSPDVVSSSSAWLLDDSELSYAQLPRGASPKESRFFGVPWIVWLLTMKVGSGKNSTGERQRKRWTKGRTKRGGGGRSEQPPHIEGNKVGMYELVKRISRW